MSPNAIAFAQRPGATRTRGAGRHRRDDERTAMRIVRRQPRRRLAMTASFDPANHRRYETRWFDDFKVGERFVLPSRTMTDALFLAFQSASGDNHPIHYDVEYCRRRGMPHMLAHGYQVLIQTAAGAGEFPFMVEDSLIAFLDQSSRFLVPVYSGDTLYPSLEIVELLPKRTTGVISMKSTVYNQKADLVMDGTQRYLVRKKP